MKKYWKRGQKTEIAKLAGITYPQLQQILTRHRGVSKERATLLEYASYNVLGKPIPFRDWLFNMTTDHKAFEGEPKNE